MTKLTSSPRFVSLPQMPSFDVKTPVLKVYQELARMNRGGFVLNYGKRQFFVKGGALFDDVIRSPRLNLRQITTPPDLTIGSLCELSEVTDAVIPIEEKAVAAGADAVPLQEVKADRVYVVTDEAGPIGYFLNHESVVDPATKRIVYICGNGHRNLDPDHGSCYSCPADIVRTEQE